MGEEMVLQQVQKRTAEELEAIRGARAARRENVKRLDLEIPDSVLKESLDQLEKEAQRGLDQAMKDSIEEEINQDLEQAIAASRQDAEAEFEEAKRESMELEEAQDEQRLNAVMET